MTDSQLTLQLDRARWWILANSPFYGQLVMSLTDTLGNPHGKTACTDGRGIMWDKDFLAKLTDEETRYVLLHETLHCAHAHLWRFPAGACDHSTANQACDHAINLTLNSAKLQIAMPKGGLANSKFSNMAEEEIYAALASQPKQQNQPGKPQAEQGSGNGTPQLSDDPCGGYCAPADDTTPANSQPVDKPGKDASQSAPQASQDTLRDEWERKVIQAAQAAKASGQGNLPGDLERILERVAACPIDWRQETAAFVKNAQSSRNDWTRSPRRHAWQPVIYPSRRQNEIGWIVGVRDTSGSIDDKLAAEFSAILASACAELNCGLILLDVDTRIQAEYRIEPCGEVPLTAKGGGGTDFICIEKRLAELTDDGEIIAGVIVLTDLCGSQFNPAEVPSLWLCTNDQQSTHGRTVRILQWFF